MVASLDEFRSSKSARDAAISVSRRDLLALAALTSVAGVPTLARPAAKGELIGQDVSLLRPGIRSTEFWDAYRRVLVEMCFADATRLVEEYRSQYEPRDESDLPPLSSQPGARSSGRLSEIQARRPPAVLRCPRLSTISKRPAPAWDSAPACIRPASTAMRWLKTSRSCWTCFQRPCASQPFRTYRWKGCAPSC